LPRGGSYRDIGEHLASWKVERNYQPRIELAKLPEFLQTELATVGKALWEAAMLEATRQFNADHERFEEMLKDERALREQALIAADLLEERVSRLTAENRRILLERDLDQQERA
jgi:hypothetical protein